MEFSIPNATIDFVSGIISDSNTTEESQYFRVVNEKIIELKANEPDWDNKAKDLQLETPNQIRIAIMAYVERKCKEKPRRISEGVMPLIHEIAQQIHSEDQSDLLEAVCERLESKFHGESLDYHLRQMNLCTTGDILYAINLYKAGRKHHLLGESYEEEKNAV